VRLVLPGCDLAPSVAAPASAGPLAKGLRILLVDDDEMLREAVSDVLAWQGHVPSSAGGGEEALLRLAAGETFDLVILDLNMPGLTGAETLPRLLALRPDQKVLLASGYTDGSVRELLEGRPNVRSLGKPFTTQELARKITDWLA